MTDLLKNTTNNLEIELENEILKLIDKGVTKDKINNIYDKIIINSDTNIKNSKKNKNENKNTKLLILNKQINPENHKMEFALEGEKIKQSIMNENGRWIWSGTMTTTRYRFWCEKSIELFKHILKNWNKLDDTDKTKTIDIIKGIYVSKN
jgi:hypothetical protein